MENILCRLCMEESENLLDLFNTNSTTQNVEDTDINLMVQKYFGFHVHLKKTDFLLKICRNCSAIIEVFHNLYIKIENGQKLFIEMMNGIDNCTSISTVPNQSMQLYMEDQEIKVENVNIELDNLTDFYLKTDSKSNDASFENDSNYDYSDNGSDVDEDMTPIKTVAENTRSKSIDNICKNKKSPVKIILKKTDSPRKSLSQRRNELEEKCKKSAVKIILKKTNSSRKSLSQRRNELEEKIAKFMKLKCDICSVNLDSLKSLKLHFKTKHNMTGYVVCCNKQFSQDQFLLGHIENHLNPDSYKCLVCKKVLSTKLNYDKHMSTKHTKKFSCPECPRTFSLKSSLDKHLPIHTPKETWAFQCDHCDRKYPSEHFKRAHILDIHEKKIICSICGKAFSSRKFREHIRNHQNSTDNKNDIQCNICGTWLKTKNSWRVHVKNHKDINEKHECSICGKLSPNKGALKIHIRNHSLTKKHVCNVCGKGFKRPLSLRQHLAIHTGDPMYKCPYCSKSFAYDSAFLNHKKKDHPDELEIERKKLRRTNFTQFVNNSEIIETAK